MKLLHRITIAFGILLLIITGITAYFIHSYLLDNLIEQQRRELQQKGQYWIEHIQSGKEAFQQTDLDQLSRLTVSNKKVEVLLIGKNKRVFFSTLPVDNVAEWIKSVETKKKKVREVWNVRNDDYIVVTFPLFNDQNQRLLLATPLRGLKEIRIEITKQILLILLIGAVVALIISFFITRGLVQPLSKLGEELKKVHKRKYSEVKLIAAKGEFAEVTNSVYFLAQELHHFHEVQKQFFQNASHELKTPLMSIQGYAEGIRDGIFADDAAEKGLNVIVQETARLKEIVTEMILLAKLESEEGIFHPTELMAEEIVKQAIVRLDPLAVKRNVRIAIRSEANGQIICVDKDKFMQALLNIIGNALRYAKENIEVKIYIEKTDLTIDIVDDGTGISEELLPNLFHRFMRGKDGETGLGLAISRAIIERSDGRITAFNGVLAGATFRITLPLTGRISSL